MDTHTYTEGAIGERLEHREKEPDRQMDRETKPGRERQSVRFRERHIKGEEMVRHTET